MAKNWKSRGAYGQILYKKIRKLNDILDKMNEKKRLDKNQLAKYLMISKVQDYSMQVQLSNIKAVEEFETLEKLETWKNELLAGRGKIPQEAVLRTKWQY